MSSLVSPRRERSQSSVGSSSREWFWRVCQVTSATRAPASVRATPAMSEAVSSATSITRPATPPRCGEVWSRTRASSIPPPAGLGSCEPQAAHQLLVATASRHEGDAARPLVDYLEAEEQVLGGQLLSSPVRPLDQEDAIGGVLLQRQVGDLLGFVEPEEVGVVDLQATAVLVHQDKGRALHRLADAQAPANALGEAGLAGAKLPFEEEDVAGLQAAGQALAEAARLAGTVADADG